MTEPHLLDELNAQYDLSDDFRTSLPMVKLPASGTNDDLKGITSRLHDVDCLSWGLDLCLCERITDDGLKHLVGMPINELDLSLCWGITNSGLKHLVGLPLSKLSLSGCKQITDEGIKPLSALPLKELDLNFCDKITDGGLKHLASLPLNQLWLSGCERLTDAGLKQISCLPLNVLRLGGCSRLTCAFRKTHLFADLLIGQATGFPTQESEPWQTGSENR